MTQIEIKKYTRGFHQSDSVQSHPRETQRRKWIVDPRAYDKIMQRAKDKNIEHDENFRMITKKNGISENE